MSRTWSGQVAAEARRSAGYERPDDAAEAIGVHRASVYAWEAGREPQLRHAVALAALYGVTLDSLFTHAPQSTTDEPRRGKDTKTPAPTGASQRRTVGARVNGD